MTDPMEGSGPVAEEPMELPDTTRPLIALPPIAGFWRRFAAILIDGVVLGVFGQMMVWTMSPFWFRIGPYGRLVGQLIALLYFGLMSSHVGDGRTVGNRLMGTAVRDRSNQPISVGRSMARTLIWLIPATLNGWSLPGFRTPFFSWFTTAMVFGVGGAVLFTMVFNGRTRQGLHDMVCGTFVVHLDAHERTAAFPTVSRLQWIASGIFLALGAVLLPVIGSMFLSQYAGRLAPVLRLHEVLDRDPRFFTSSVVDQTYSGSDGQSTHALQISVWYKGNPPEDVREKAMNDIVRTALATIEGIERYDQMQVGITSGYDLGIATGRVVHNERHTIQEWRKTLAAQPSR